MAAVKESVGPGFAARFDPAKTNGSRPLSPQQSLAAITPRPGVRVDLVAAEPLVADPVALAFGADGRLWAAEMADSPSGPTDGKFDPGGRVVSLRDSDGGGAFDTSTVFLDGLPFPTGLVPWRKGMLICAAPDILYAEDADGDGRADKVEKLYSGSRHSEVGRRPRLAERLAAEHGDATPRLESPSGGPRTAGKSGLGVPATARPAARPGRPRRTGSTSQGRHCGHFD